MQKALILALLFGAFFSHQSNSQETEPTPLPVCDEGETILSNIGACGVMAPENSCTLTSIRTLSGVTGTNTYSSLSQYKSALTINDGTFEPPACAFGTLNKTTKIETTDTLNTACPSDLGSGPTVKKTVNFTQTRNTTSTRRVGDGTVNNLQCTYTDTVTPTNFNASAELTFEVSGDFECPESHPLGPINYDDGTLIGKYCYRIPEDVPQDCPTEPGPNPIFYIGQQGGGTACIEEDNGSICPYVEEPNLPGYYTADFANPQACAGQEPEEPDLKPDCTEGGNGMTVCKADPDEKCSVNSTGLLTCEANCGYINGQFYCPEEPDIPELPDPEINDDIQDPNKPMSDMVKKDFKDVLIGAETRLSSIKKELEDVQLSNDKNTDKLSDKLTGLGAKIDQVNRNLVGIQGTLDETLYGEQLEIDTSGFQDEINQGLGVTGDESVEDLEGDPISLDDFSGNYQFSLGTGSCPADRQVTLLGKPISVSWQPFCDVFNFIGVLVQISAYLFSIYIVFGGRK